MKKYNLYVGSWVPRTTIHLEEFSQFLKLSKGSSGLDIGKLQKLHEQLSPQDINFTKAKIDRLTARLSGYQFDFLEDGTIVLGTITSKENTFEGLHKLTQYYVDRVLPAYSYLYSRGAPIPKSLSHIRDITPSIITSSEMSLSDAKELFAHFSDSIIETYHKKNNAIYVGHDIVAVAGDGADDLELVRYLVFLRDYKQQLEKLLNAHRQMWEEVTTIREHDTVHFSDLPKFRDDLLNLTKDISFFKSRLAQMDIYIKKRMEALDELLKRSLAKDYVSEELSSLLDAHEYFVDLWEMTENYANSTFDLISLLYQENEQKEINMLQIIFIIGVLASLLTLGAMPGANLTFRNSFGEVIARGQLESFSLLSFVQFGSIAFITSVVVYYVLHLAFTRVKRLRVLDRAINRAKSMETIFKYLK